MALVTMSVTPPLVGRIERRNFHLSHRPSVSHLWDAGLGNALSLSSGGCPRTPGPWKNHVSLGCSQNILTTCLFNAWSLVWLALLGREF